jgi:hypothetical protein
MSSWTYCRIDHLRLTYHRMKIDDGRGDLPPVPQSGTSTASTVPKIGLHSENVKDFVGAKPVGACGCGKGPRPGGTVYG